MGFNKIDPFETHAFKATLSEYMLFILLLLVVPIQQLLLFKLLLIKINELPRIRNVVIFYIEFRD